MRPSRARTTAAACAALILLGASACGGDDDDAVDDTTTTAAAEAEADLASFCAVAEQLAQAGGPPSEALLAEYRDLAPEAIRDDAELVTGRLIEEGPAAFNDDAVQGSLGSLSEFEEAECGITQEQALPDGVTAELDPAATRVDVSAPDYDFLFDAPSAGPTSFVMSNDGEEPHFMAIAKLVPGTTMEEALEADDPTAVTELIAESAVVGPGEEAVLTFEDLQPGDYAMVCFIPDADGTPHAFLGMAVPFTVS